MLIDRTKYVLDTLSTEYTKQIINDSCRSLIVYVQREWDILHNDDNRIG